MGFRALSSIRRTRHCACSGLARKYEDGLEGPYRRWSRHPDETREYLYNNWIPRRCPAAVIRERVRKLGMDVFECPPDLAIGFRLCLYFITLWLFNYFLITVWLHAFHFYVYQLCTLVLLVLLSLGNKMENKWKKIQTYIPNKWGRD